MASSDPLMRVLAGNQTYARRTAETDPTFFTNLGTGQAPSILWIGCADSRVPETTVCDCKPGEIFVHRNIANVVQPGDINSASVIEYAVGALNVQRVIVCGHTKCGGATAALGDADLGETLNRWIEPVRELRRRHEKVLEALEGQDKRANRLAELNVKMSVETVLQVPTVRKAIEERGLTVHGVIYDIPTGELKVLEEKDI